MSKIVYAVIWEDRCTDTAIDLWLDPESAVGQAFEIWDNYGDKTLPESDHALVDGCDWLFFRYLNNEGDTVCARPVRILDDEDAGQGRSN